MIIWLTAWKVSSSKIYYCYVLVLKFFILLLLKYLHICFQFVAIITTDSIIIQLQNKLHQSYSSETWTAANMPKFVNETKHKCSDYHKWHSVFLTIMALSNTSVPIQFFFSDLIKKRPYWQKYTSYIIGICFYYWF
jgi:hypothetical protein